MRSMRIRGLATEPRSSIECLEPRCLLTTASVVQQIFSISDGQVPANHASLSSGSGHTILLDTSAGGSEETPQRTAKRWASMADIFLYTGANVTTDHGSNWDSRVRLYASQSIYNGGNTADVGFSGCGGECSGRAEAHELGHRFGLGHPGGIYLQPNNGWGTFMGGFNGGVNNVFQWAHASSNPYVPGHQNDPIHLRNVLGERPDDFHGTNTVTFGQPIHGFVGYNDPDDTFQFTATDPFTVDVETPTFTSLVLNNTINNQPVTAGQYLPGDYTLTVRAGSHPVAQTTQGSLGAYRVVFDVEEQPPEPPVPPPPPPPPLPTVPPTLEPIDDLVLQGTPDRYITSEIIATDAESIQVDFLYTDVALDYYHALADNWYGAGEKWWRMSDGGWMFVLPGTTQGYDWNHSATEWLDSPQITVIGGDAFANPEVLLDWETLPDRRLPVRDGVVRVIAWSSLGGAEVEFNYEYLPVAVHGTHWQGYDWYHDPWYISPASQGKWLVTDPDDVDQFFRLWDGTSFESSPLVGNRRELAA